MEKNAFGAVRALVAAVALGCVMLLGACSGTSPEELVRADLTSALDLIKNADQQTIDNLMGTVDVDTLEGYGLDGGQLAASLLDGFDYEIEGVTVDGDTATATVSITCKSVTSLFAEVEPLVTELAADPSTSEMTEEELYARVGELMMEALDATEPRQTTVEVTYLNGEGGWEIDDASGTALAEVFL